MTPLPLAELAGWAALVAAAATVIGMVTLLLFFRRGGRWGPANDAASVVLMLALVPVALALAELERPIVGDAVATLIAAIGIVPMVVVAVLQALLVVGRVTYEQTKLAVLGFGAVVGVWYLLTALATADSAVPLGLRLAAAAAGLGFIAVGIGFVRGGERHPASAIGGLVLFVASLAVQVWLGILFLGGALPLPGRTA